MARKTFISYKYSEAQNVRDAILKSLGEDASYYQGETSDSPDLTDTSTENIKELLTGMMYNTSVTIVVISPNIKLSKWIDWEIEYCLKEISREGRTSKTNGIVGVIQKVNGAYDWFESQSKNLDGCSASWYVEDFVHDIIRKNRYNQKPKRYLCSLCKTIDPLCGSYISYVEEATFLESAQKYIENAFDKSENAESYELVKLR